MNNNELEQKNLQADAATYADDLLDWDDEIQEESRDYPILPEGEYLFEVEKMERGTFLGSKKLPPYKEVKLTLRVETPDGPVRLRESFRLLRRFLFLIYPFFVSIGVIEDGEKGRMDWNRVPGARGRLHSKPGQFTGEDGQTRDKNEVTWLPYDVSKMPDEGFRELDDSQEELPF